MRKRSKTREKVLFLVVDKVVIGLLIVLATFVVNSALDRGRARQALAAEFARARTDRIVPVLQTQARADAALLRTADAFTSFRESFDKFTSASSRFDAVKTPRGARQRQALFRLSERNRRLAAKSEARYEAFTVAAVRYVRAVTKESSLLDGNRFWLGGRLYDELDSRRDLHIDAQQAIQRVQVNPQCLLLDDGRCPVPTEVTNVFTAVQKAKERDITSLIDAFSQGA